MNGGRLAGVVQLSTVGLHDRHKSMRALQCIAGAWPLQAMRRAVHCACGHRAPGGMQATLHVPLRSLGGTTSF